MDSIQIIKYSVEYKEKWDNFVLHDSINGTFLQSRSFLEYHKSKFFDHSLLFLRGNMIVAVCPACEVVENDAKKFMSHIGSTFGGIIIGKNFNNIGSVIEIFNSLDLYLKNNYFDFVLMKSTGDIFCKGNCNLVDYCYYKYGYHQYNELSFAFDYSKWNSEDYFMNFKSKTRNLYRTSLKNNLVLKKLTTKDDIYTFYLILCDSLKKYDTTPVHSYEELIDLYENRISNSIRFYGVFYDNKMIAGSMVFIINDVFHTQYLCANREYLYLKPMDFMDGSLICIAYDEGYSYFSFGISTENKGLYLNEGLAKYKEGFGTEYFINKTFYKKINQGGDDFEN